MLNKRTEEIMDILACPSCKKKVFLVGGEIACNRCEVKYLLDEEGIPVMLSEKVVPNVKKT